MGSAPTRAHCCGTWFPSFQVLAFAVHHPDVPLRHGLAVEATCENPDDCVTSEHLRVFYAGKAGLQGKHFESLSMDDIVAMQQQAKNDSRIGMQSDRISLEVLNDLHKKAPAELDNLHVQGEGRVDALSGLRGLAQAKED